MQATSQLVNAIVLKVFPQGEADLLADLFTREKGRLSGIARHARRSKVRFGTLLAPFNTLKVRLKEKGGLAFLEEATLAVPLAHLALDLERMGVAFYFVDCIRNALPERDPEPKTFDLLSTVFKALNRGDPPRTVRLVFEMRLMNLLGFAPSLGSCVRCRREALPLHFVFKEGALFCRGCRPAGSVSTPLSAASLKALEVIEEKGFCPTDSAAVLDELEQFLPRHLEYSLGRAPRAGSLMKVLI